MEPTRQMTRDLSDTSNEKGTRILPPSNQQPNSETNKKTSYAAPALGGKNPPTEDPPTTYTNDSMIECNGTPTEDWLRQQALASIRRPLTQPEKEETYAQDKDYRDDHTHHANLIVQPPCSTKEQSVATQIEQNENAPNNQLSSQSTEGDTYGSPKKPSFLDDFPTFLNSIKEYVTEKDGSTYIPLHSTIPLKKRRRMIYLPVEFEEITMDGLADSGAFINAMS